MNILKKTYYSFYSLVFCLRYLPLKQAIKIPILVWPRIKILHLRKGAIVLKTPIYHSMAIIGFPGADGRGKNKTGITIRNEGKLIIGHNVTMAKGTNIVINGGELCIGDNFFCNTDCFFYCNRTVSIGNNNMYGWDVHFNTTDGHTVYENNIPKEQNGKIKIGNHVWIGSYCLIGKGVRVADDCVIAQRSVVLKSHLLPNTLIAGCPAKDTRKNYNWSS